MEVQITYICTFKYMSAFGIKLLSAFSPHVAIDFHKPMKCVKVVQFVPGAERALMYGSSVNRLGLAEFKSASVLSLRLTRASF